MKVNRLETHDRLQQFQSQWDVIAQGAEECIRNVPDSITFPFYVFGHPRTIEFDEQVSILQTPGLDIQKTPTTRFIWIPRSTKPKAQTNSYLFMARKGSDNIKTIWLLPPRELWSMYEPGKLTENEDIWTSIQNFLYHRQKLEENEPDGPTAANVDEWRRIYAYEAAQKKAKQATLEASLTSY